MRIKNTVMFWLGVALLILGGAVFVAGATIGFIDRDLSGAMATCMCVSVSGAIIGALLMGFASEGTAA